MSGQAWLFFSTVLAGAGIGLFYDFFRILRKTAPRLAKSRAAVHFEDLFFWVLTTGGMFYFLLSQNYGEIRLFALLGAAIGLVLYFATISRFIVSAFVATVEYMKKVIAAAVRILLTPLRLAWNAISPKIRSGLSHIRRYGKIRIRKSARNLFILRKKV